MNKHVFSLSKIILMLIFTLSISQMKATPAVKDSTSANALSFLQAQPESTHFEYSENPLLALTMSMGVGNNVWTNELYTVDPGDLGSSAVLTGTSAVSSSGDFAPGDPDHMWVIDANDSNLKRVNVNTGSTDQQVLLNHTFPDGTWTVLSINKITGEFYGVATDGTASELYLIDPASGSTTPLVFLEIPAIVSGTFDGGNQLFLFDILNDEMWVINVQTNTLNMLGGVGFDGNYAQGMGFDPFSGEIYLAAYNNVDGAELRVLDQLTGNTTLLGALPGETTGFGFTQSQQQDLFLQAGPDQYTIPYGALTFGEDMPEIPQGFFGPGSEPFFGQVNLEGANSNGGMVAHQDVIINRLEDLPTPELPTTGTIPIEMTELNLRSVQPITVQTGNGPSHWHVEVGLFDDAPSQGSAEINRPMVDGGDFTMWLSLYPVIIFTNVDNPSQVLIFNPIEFGFTGLQLSQPNPFGWMAPPIPNEFDPFGEEGLRLITSAGNEILLVPFLIRNDYLFLSMDNEGQPESWEGTGYNNSEWYYYPFTDWWNVWFYDHPLDVTRHKLVSGNLQILPRDPSLPSYVEIIVNWSTPEWPQWPGFPEVPQPPLPDLMVDPEYENLVIERSEPIFTLEQSITEPIDVPIPSEYLNNLTGLFNFNPEWVSIDLRGYNFSVSGELIHICFKPWTNCEVVCPEDMEVCFTDEPFALTGASPAGGTYSGNGVNANGVFNPGNASWGENVITYTYVCPDGTQVSCEFTIYVIPPPEMVCPPNLMVCLSDGIITLPDGIPSGGTYSGTGIVGSNKFSTIQAGIGTHEITYTVTDPCPGSCTFTITVNPNPEVICPDDFRMCSDDDPIDLMTLVSPSGGSFTGGQIFDPASAPPGVPLQIKYTYIDPDTGCEGSCTFYITVWPKPELQCPEDFNLCADDGPVDLMTLVNPQGGTFSGGQIFDPSQAPPGVPLQTWYTYVDPDTGCEATCIFYITVWPTPEIECPEDFTMCASDDPIDLMTLVSPQGGTFSGGQIFDPSTAPPGVPLQIMYTYVDPETGCDATCIFYITVYPNPEIECPEDFKMCANDDPIDLMTLVSPAGGSFTGGQIFDPSTAPPGVPLQIKYTYVDPDTGCEASCVFYITVYPNPEVICPDDFTMCADDDPIDLMTMVTPTGGTFSGGRIFDPSTAPPGVPLQIHYTYVDPDTGCEGRCIFYITVYPNPEVVCPDDKELCIDDAAITLTATPAGGSYSGAGISGNSFDPFDAGVGVHTIEYCYTDPDTGCEGCCEFKITVHDLPDVECPDDIEVCVDDPEFTLTGATPAGGVYSDAAGNALTKFDPASAGVGVHAIFYDYTDPDTGCEAWCVFFIEVHPLPDVDCPDDIEVCANDPSFTLGGATPAGGAYSDALGNVMTTFNPAAAGVGAHAIFYDYTDPDTGCENWCVFFIDVLPLPTVNCPADTAVCEDDLPFALAGGTPAGGTYSGTGVAGGIFNPAAAGDGVHTIKYTYTDPLTGCSNSCTFKITVHELPDVDCPPNITVCDNDPPFALAGATPAGGIYSDVFGIPVAIFNPAAWGVGVHTIFYDYTDPATGCANWCSFTITVVAAPVVTCPPNITVCDNDPSFDLTGGTPAGGVYTNAAGTTITKFYPATAPVGANTITYTYTDPVTGCSNFCTFTITVIASPNVTCPPNQTVCIDNGPIVLGGGLPVGGWYVGPGVAGGVFKPLTAGAGIHTIRYSYTDPITGCTGSCTFIITVNPLPNVVCPNDMMVCEDDSAFVLAGATPVGGTYSGTGVAGGSFNPGAAAVGAHTITYGYTNPNTGCSDSCNFTITVNAKPVVSCPPDTTVHVSDTAWALTGGTPVGGVYIDAAGNAIAIFDPAVAGIGDHTITYGYTDVNGCSDSCTFVIIVTGQQDELDFGDAPDGIGGFSYNTVLANMGARHMIDPDIYLGDRIDAEGDGQPTFGADGDDLATSDDEDGVTLPVSVTPGSTVTIAVKASVDGYLDGWMDFNLDGTWMGPSEHIFISQFVVAGMNSLSFTVPAGAVIGESYMRFRFRDYAGGMTFRGLAQNGEVEDYRLKIDEEPQQEMDFGDAPDNGGAYDYHTLAANNGARHEINPDVFLGNLIDAEINGQPTLPALGDDNNVLDDEDGVRMRRFMAVGDTAKVSVKASVDGFLNAWIDFNRDGKWSGPAEQIFTDEPLVAGWNTLKFYVPTFAEQGRSYARFRYNTTGGLTYEGPAADGEVEDYLVAIFPAGWGFDVTDLSHLIVVPVDVNQVLKGSDSYSLTQGDFLGAFFQDGDDYHNAGAILWQGDDNQVLIAYGDDPTTPEKEGFEEGEMMTFKVFIGATGEEFEAQVAFDPDQPNADGKFHNNGLSALTNIELLTLSQTLDLSEGWSGLSTFLEPANTNVEEMFSPVVDDMVVLYKLNGSMYWPAENLNTLNQWDAYDGHVIKMSQDAALEVAGTELANKTLQLQEGLNLIPVLSAFPMDIEMLFSTLPGVVLVKEVAGTGVYLPDWNINTIGAVVPGSAYFVLTSQAGNISFDLGSNKSGTVYEPDNEVTSPWNIAEQTPGSHVVVFSLSDDAVQHGDVIGGFTADGHCAGAVAIDGDSFALTLNPDDPFDGNISGFEAGEQIVLKLYREASGEVFELEAEYTERFDQQYFVGNGLSEVTGLKASSTGTIEDLTAEITVYPNPSSGIFNISNAGEIELIEVMDSYGKLIINEKPGFDRRVDLSNYPTGIYFLKAIATDGSESTHKLIVR